MPMRLTKFSNLDSTWRTAQSIAWHVMKGKILWQTSTKHTHAWSTKKLALAYTEDTLSQACALFDADPSQTITGVAKQLNIPYSTPHGHHHQLHTASHIAHKKQQLLNPDEEQAVCDWIEHLLDQGQPLNKKTMWHLVHKLCGIWPNQKWVYCFLTRHPELVLGKPLGLNPKWAQAFNRTAVRNHFNLFWDIKECFNIPYSHIYNMDEKGVQRGGGQKLQTMKYFVPWGWRLKYKLQSATLELVTIIKCVCANASHIKPGFVFSGKEFQGNWFDEDPELLWAILTLLY